MTSIANFTDETLPLPLSSERVRVFSLGNDRYEPSLPRPPSCAIDDAGLREREQYVDELRPRLGMSPRLEAFHDLWLMMCRAAVNADEASRGALLAQAATLEGGLRLWWDEVHSPSGLVRALRRQADLLGLYILWARYGDYAAESLKIVKQASYRKSLLKPLFEGVSWMDAGTEVEKEALALAGAAGEDALEAPWHAHLEKVASEFKLDADELFAAVTFYAERNQMCHLGVTDLVKKGQHRKVAEMLLKDEEHVKKVFGEWPKRRKRVEQTLRLLKKTLFDECEYDKEKGVVRYKISGEVRHAEKREGKKEARRKEKEQRKCQREFYQRPPTF